MSKKKLLWISIALAAVFVLPACLRQASQSPQPTPTGSTSPYNMARPTGLGSLQIIGTQTALALASPLASSPNAVTPLPSPTQTFSALATQTPNSLTPVNPVLPSATIGTPVVIVIPTSTPGRPASYSLQQGEYPYCIARRFNVNPGELLTLNNLPENPPLLQPGTVLQIPQTGNPFPGGRALHTHPTTFTVSSVDETIYGVACYFGDVDPTAIAAANALVPPYTLHVGQSLSIP